MRDVSQKIAFIHFAKAAGRYTDYYLQDRVFNQNCSNQAMQQYKVFNSWQVPYSLDRDWSEKELIQFAINQHPFQCPTPNQIRTHHTSWSHDYLSRQYVHNHHHNWTGSTVEMFQKNGWFTFMFIREPSELLCSLWTYAASLVENNNDFLFGNTWPLNLSLDEYIQVIIKRPDLHTFYALPDYVDMIEFVAEFTDENFRELLLGQFNYQYKSELASQKHHFASGNPGYASYRAKGLISDDTHTLINNDPDVNMVRERLGCIHFIDM